MTDKEQILIKIISQLSSTLLLENINGGWNYDERFEVKSLGTLVHFVPNYIQKPKEGDLVLCSTLEVCPFKIGFVHQIINDYEMVIREIGTKNLCKVGNEEFKIIKGMHPIDLYDGENKRFYEKVIKAFKKGIKENYLYRFGGIDLFKENNENKARIWIREAHGLNSVPFSVEIKWNNKISIKTILDLLIKGGYGTRKFQQK
jgi:hypothetical protein